MASVTNQSPWGRRSGRTAGDIVAAVREPTAASGPGHRGGFRQAWAEAAVTRGRASRSRPLLQTFPPACPRQERTQTETPKGQQGFVHPRQEGSVAARIWTDKTGGPGTASSTAPSPSARKLTEWALWGERGH